MTLKQLLSLTRNFILDLTKVKVVDLLVQLQKEYTKLEIENLTLKAQLLEIKLKGVNLDANKPSSKQPEWEDKASKNKDPKNDDPTKPTVKEKKNKKKKRKARKGSGNSTKNRQPTKTETAKVDVCDHCGKNLKNATVLESTNEHIVEDIAEPQEITEIIKIIKEKKYCNNCQQVTTAKSGLALPGADIGLNATVLICYLWVSLCLPFTKIKSYLNSFFGLKISTSGLSKHVIMVS